METIRIRDEKKSDPEAGINVPDPQHRGGQGFLDKKEIGRG
jgi:hypothetical protein